MTDGWYDHATPLPTQSFWIGNEGFGALVMHIAADHNHSAESYLAHTTGKSAHFYVRKDGHVTQYVKISNSAWANGLTPLSSGGWASPEGNIVRPGWTLLRRGRNPNHYTVSMEHEGQSNEPWTAAMFDSTVRLMKWMAPLKGVSWWIKGQNLIGHCDISPIDRPNCPGPHCNMQALALAANARRMVAITDTPIYEVPAVNPTRVALRGAALLRQGTECMIAMGYANGMVWLADGTGFVEGIKLRSV